MDKKVFEISANGGKRFTLADNIEIGNYNMLMAESPLYDAINETNQSSHDLFRSTFKSGFPWEVLEVFGGKWFSAVYKHYAHHLLGNHALKRRYT